MFHEYTSRARSSTFISSGGLGGQALHAEPLLQAVELKQHTHHLFRPERFFDKAENLVASMEFDAARNPIGIQC